MDNAIADESLIVGFVGLGDMGGPMAHQIANKCPNRTIVFDISMKALEPFQGKAEIATSPADMARRADIIIGCLPTVASYREAILGPGGLIEGGRVSIYVHVGTTGSPLVRELARPLADKGVAIVDAPMAGGPARARAASMVVMSSGDPEMVKKVEPFLRCYANKVVHVGSEAGAGQVMKVVNNIMSSTNLAICAEALVLGAKGGLDPEQILEVVNAGTGENYASRNWVPEQILTRKFDMSAQLVIMLKDIQAGLDEAADLGVTMAVGKAVHKIYERAVVEGSSRHDITTIIQPMERDAGIQVQKTR
jgi:3-hydroxyisobutyrate dehydrogenase-like beta-hydroxyacid dehydrogenase